MIKSMKEKREFENRPLNYLQRVALEELLKEECIKENAKGSNRLNFHKWAHEINEFSPSNEVAQGTVVKTVEEICKELGLTCVRNYDSFYTSHDITW